MRISMDFTNKMRISKRLKQQGWRFKEFNPQKHGSWPPNNSTGVAENEMISTEQITTGGRINAETGWKLQSLGRWLKYDEVSDSDSVLNGRVFCQNLYGSISKTSSRHNNHLCMGHRMNQMPAKGMVLHWRPCYKSSWSRRAYHLPSFPFNLFGHVPTLCI